MWQCSFAGFFDIFGITKCGKVILLQSVTDFIKVLQVLQSVTVTTKWDVTQYIDAIIALFKSFGHLKRLHSYLNSCYVHVSFTRDIKENNKILLFDANVIRRQGNWKPPSGGAYTHFDSFFVLYIQNHYELHVMYFWICSNWSMFHSQLTLLKQIFQKNGYPENFFDKCFKLLLNRNQVLKEKVSCS